MIPFTDDVRKRTETGLLGNIFQGWTFLPARRAQKSFIIMQLSLASRVP
jgi:hypothetical protein